MFICIYLCVPKKNNFCLHFAHASMLVKLVYASCNGFIFCVHNKDVFDFSHFGCGLYCLLLIFSLEDLQ